MGARINFSGEVFGGMGGKNFGGCGVVCGGCGGWVRCGGVVVWCSLV